jgi:hypothetical protein
MRDRTRVALGLGAFLLLAAYPVWNALGGTADPGRPELEPAVEQPDCVEDSAYMAANHQELLNRWRTAVVRDGERTYVSSTGVEHEMSLTNTCLRCHADQDAFCGACHRYAEVEPTCWNCHVVPEGL